MNCNKSTQSLYNTTYQSISEHIKPVVIAVYSLISAMAVTGNVAVLFVIMRFRVMHSPANFLIGNLALADLLMAIFCIPLSYWPMLILEYWPFGRVLCKFINYAKVVTVFLSSYTLVAISFDRFAAVVFPMGHYFRLSSAGVGVMIGFLWVWALSFASPLLLVQDIRLENCSEICAETWSESAKKSYGLVIFVLQFVIPVLVLIVTYSAIGLKMWLTPVPGQVDCLRQRRCSSDARRNSVKKMVPMMVLVTSLYTICWMPQNVLINILVPIYPELQDHTDILYIWWICHATAMSHTVVNPIIYACKNLRFREGFSYVFQWVPGVTFDGIRLDEARRRASETSTFRDRVHTSQPDINNVGSLLSLSEIRAMRFSRTNTT